MASGRFQTLTTTTLALLLGLFIPRGHALGYELTDVSDELGLDDINGVSVITGWLDIDLDGLNEPFFWNVEHLYYVDHGENGLELKEAKIIRPNGPVLDPATVTVTFDIDGDGIRELMVMGRETHLYRIVASGTLEMVDSPFVRFPPTRLPSDASVGDFNLDGLPDVLIATMGFEGQAMVYFGARDMIYMNRGGGVFELLDALPAKRAMTHSHTVVDIDLDGRPDYVESVNYSGMSGPSRILLNRTEPGAKDPHFIVSDFTFDTASFGMGVAIEDIDGDGILDVYNASTGRDFMMMGNADGTYRDETFQRRFFHEFGQPPIIRIQWAPSWDDINGDGYLDLFCRHGHLGDNQIFGLGAQLPEPHLVYLGSADGTFQRVAVPYDLSADIGGVDASLGDVDGDGLPEVVMGSTFGAWGSGYGIPESDPTGIFLRNDSVVPETTRRLTVHLKPTVSTDPPVGARLVARCGDHEQIRHVTHGGKLGSAMTDEVRFFWPGCQDAPSVEVFWPTGAHSTHTYPGEAIHVNATEPDWWDLQAQGADWELILDPSVANKSEACFQLQGAQAWSCCSAADAPCAMPYAPQTGKRGFVRLGEAWPQALPRLTGELTFRTTPLLPHPGKDFQVHLQWYGLAGSFDKDALWIRSGGEKIPWDSVDVEKHRFTATVTADPSAPTMEIDLLHDFKVVDTHSVTLGYNVDPDRMDLALYATQYPLAGIPWTLLISASADVNYDNYVPDELRLQKADGTPIATGIGFDYLGQLRIVASFEGVESGTEVFLYDGTRQLLGPLRINHEPTAEELLKLVKSAKGFSQRSAIVEDGDTTRVLFTLLDEVGSPLPPNPSIIKVEVDGGDVLDDVVVLTPEGLAPRLWELTVGVRAHPGVGPGEIRVYTTEGLLLASWAFERRAPADVACDLTKSYGSLGHESIPAGVGATTELRVYPLNEYGEMLGKDAAVEVHVPPAIRLSSLEITSGGFYVATVYADYYGGDFPLDVHLNGEYAFTLLLGVVGPSAPPMDPPTVTWPEIDSDVAGTEPELSDPVEPPQEGCASSRGSSSGLPWSILGALALFVCGGRRRGMMKAI